MVNRKNKRCQHVGCTKGPVMSFPGDKKASRCKTHMLKGMVVSQGSLTWAQWAECQKDTRLACLTLWMTRLSRKTCSVMYDKRRLQVQFSHGG